MKASIIKAITQTQFETCIAAFIAFDSNQGGKSCLDGICNNFLLEGYSLMIVLGPNTSGSKTFGPNMF